VSNGWTRKNNIFFQLSNFSFKAFPFYGSSRKSSGICLAAALRDRIQQLQQQIEAWEALVLMVMLPLPRPTDHTSS
jgi:hypothetical protein